MSGRFVGSKLASIKQKCKVKLSIKRDWARGSRVGRELGMSPWSELLELWADARSKGPFVYNFGLVI